MDREELYDYGDEVTTDEVYIRDINERFFQYAKNQSVSLRRGAFGLDPVSAGAFEALFFGDDAYDGASTMIRYDRAMLPHWEEFCNAMKSWQFYSCHYSVRGTIDGTMPCATSNCPRMF